MVQQRSASKAPLMNPEPVAKLHDFIQHCMQDDTIIDKVEALRISSELCDLVSMVRHLSVAAQTTQRDHFLLKSLCFGNIRTRQRKIEKAHVNTFSWIFNSSTPNRTQRPIRFRDWLSTENGVFWIQGKPGSGKSTLIKFISSAKETCFYLTPWAREKRLLQKSQEGLLRSVLYKILRQTPELIPVAREAIACSEDGGEMDSGSWSLEILLRMYESVVTQTALPVKFCFFIDGLDEFQDENRSHTDLLKTLRDMKHSEDIKLCVSSRPWFVFSDKFSGNPDWVLKLEDLTRGDISRYVTDKLNKHPQFSTLSRLNPAYREFIASVVTKAQGVFLWVYLVVRNLLEGLTYHDSVRTLRMRLEAFPPDLKTFFQHLINSVPSIYRLQLARSFHITVAAGEPVPAMFYSFLDNVGEEPQFATRLAKVPLSKDELMLRLERLRRRLDGRSRGLLEVVGFDSTVDPDTEGLDKTLFLSTTVDFLHRTVRDFIHDSKLGPTSGGVGASH
ncbi:hypothetical protein QBC34DRAFT_466867 [Podospora aff. communis PSN243]|uniref:NACHT domain-containing protein n=1 Tax=Podospora aff. communis PSN243 TaxID=3040156 RepID=A0AAV9GI28_9PEZI|nr:hypothetical protein QBC34DRAFT_466867 [Podospora aff. communis PSN243]